VTLNANVGGAGSGPYHVNTNTNGGGADDHAMNPGSSITNPNAHWPPAARINVNAAGRWYGCAAVGSIAVGSGGGIAVGHQYRGNATGASITQLEPVSSCRHGP